MIKRWRNIKKTKFLFLFLSLVSITYVSSKEFRSKQTIEFIILIGIIYWFCFIDRFKRVYSKVLYLYIIKIIILNKKYVFIPL